MRNKREVSNLGEIKIARQVIVDTPSTPHIRRIIALLTASVALMMTGFGIILPVFARRFSEFGDGVEALGMMTTAFALAQLIFAPLLGSWADRFGRRPFVLIALAAFALTNVGYLLATSTFAIVIIRFLGGMFSAGLLPAAMGIVADITPEDRRAKWIGLVMGGYAIGLVFGPVLGGILYDGWGFSAPFVTSGVLALAAFISATILVPETRPPQVRYREALSQRRQASNRAAHISIWQALPRPLSVFTTLLFIDFSGAFAFAFIEPQLVFYVYDELGWSTIQFGLVVGSYGLAMGLGQTLLGHLSDRFGRKPIIIIGIMLNTVLYITVAYVTYFPLILLNSAIAGFGAALVAPALSAFYIDITAKAYRSRILGIKGAALALGGVAGPMLVVIATNLISSQAIFLTAGVFVLSGAILALVLLAAPQQKAADHVSLTTPIFEQRTVNAQAALHGLVLQATIARHAYQQPDFKNPLLTATQAQGLLERKSQ